MNLAVPQKTAAERWCCRGPPRADGVIPIGCVPGGRGDLESPGPIPCSLSLSSSPESRSVKRWPRVSQERSRSLCESLPAHKVRARSCVTRSILKACDTEVAQLEELRIESEVRWEVETNSFIKLEGG